MILVVVLLFRFDVSIVLLLFIVASGNGIFSFILLELFFLSIICLLIYIGSTFERLRASLYLGFFSLVIGFLLISHIGFEVLGVFLLLVLLAKLPFYRLHIWLPKVHVEASLLRSVFLAGIILKGGSVLYYLVGVFVPVVIVLSMVSLLIIRSVDRKGIVALSSVLHMSVCAFSVFVI